MSEWQSIVENLDSALQWLDVLLERHSNDTQARLWRDHLAEDYKSLSLHAQKTQEVG